MQIPSSKKLRSVRCCVRLRLSDDRTAEPGTARRLQEQVVMPRPDRFFATRAPSKESFGLDPRFHGQTWTSFALSAVSMFRYLFLDQRGGATTRGLIPKTRRPLERSFATSMAVLIPSMAPKQTKCSIANCDDGKSCVPMARWLFEQGFLSASRTFDGTIIFCRLAPIDLINKFNIACFSRTTVVRYQIFGRIKRPQHSASS